MHEHIILTPGLNGNELIKNLALHGVNCFNLRIVSAGELARIALMRSGISVSEEFIDSNEQIALIAKAVKDVEYFGKPSFVDIRNITAAVDQMRSLVAEQDEAAVLKDTLSKGIFIEKNNALLNVYERYMQILEDMDAIDSVMLIRKAIAKCSAITAEFSVLEEYPLNPLQNALIQKVSGGNVKTASISSLYGASDKPLKISSYKNCYGASNEVETILADIYSGKNIDECTVAITDPATYGQLFFDYALLYDIPMTFGCGIPVINSNPGKLLSLYNYWSTGGFFGTDAVMGMIFSDCFNRGKLSEVLSIKDEDVKLSRFYKFLGEIKFTNDLELNKKRLIEYRKAVEEDAKYIIPGESKEYGELVQKQKCLPLLEIMAEELSLPAEEFISKYAYLRLGSRNNAQKLTTSFDRAALSAIYEELKVIRASGISQSDGDIIINILKLSVLGQKSEPGCLHVTTINRAISSVRDNLYIAGLSSSKYPGSPKENYLLLDSDIELFGEGAKEQTSEGRIKKKRTDLLDLAMLASALGSEIYLSYSGMNVSELKRDNASSMVFELYCKAHGENVTAKELEADTVKVDYFEPAVSASRNIGKAFIGNKLIIQKEAEYNSPEAKWNIDKEYSPTAIETFIGCPRSFLIGYILGIPEPDDNDAFEVISSRDRGTLAHSVMEQIANKEMSNEEFLKISGEFFDRYITEHPPLLVEKVNAERELFLEIMENAYKSDPHREVILKEQDIHCTHSTGVKLHGFPDRVEKLEDGSLLIVDYKTGRNVYHTEDDIISCLQIVIYAYLMESMGHKVSGGEYRYIRLNQTIKCRYDEEMKEKLSVLLGKFKDMMTSGYFPCGEACGFCKYGEICGLGQEKDIFSAPFADGVSDKLAEDECDD